MPVSWPRNGVRTKPSRPTGTSQVMAPPERTTLRLRPTTFSTGTCGENLPQVSPRIGRSCPSHSLSLRVAVSHQRPQILRLAAGQLSSSDRQPDGVSEPGSRPVGDGPNTPAGGARSHHQRRCRSATRESRGSNHVFPDRAPSFHRYSDRTLNFSWEDKKRHAHDVMEPGAIVRRHCCSRRVPHRRVVRIHEGKMSEMAALRSEGAGRVVGRGVASHQGRNRIHGLPRPIVRVA
jgi:hypothetical protein